MIRASLRFEKYRYNINNREFFEKFSLFWNRSETLVMTSSELALLLIVVQPLPRSV